MFKVSLSLFDYFMLILSVLSKIFKNRKELKRRWNLPVALFNTFSDSWFVGPAGEKNVYTLFEIIHFQTMVAAGFSSEESSMCSNVCLSACLAKVCLEQTYYWWASSRPQADFIYDRYSSKCFSRHFICKFWIRQSVGAQMTLSCWWLVLMTDNPARWDEDDRCAWCGQSEDNLTQDL